MKRLLVATVWFAACGDNADPLAPDAGPEPDGPVEPAPEPGIRFFEFPIAVDVSPDGTLATFEEMTSTAATVHVFDTVAGEDRYTVEVGDGSLIFGGIGDALFSIPVAFVWDAAHGTRPLADIVTAAGITLPEGTLLNNVLGASADGTVLAGTAMDAQGAPLTFVLRLPPTAYATP